MADEKLNTGQEQTEQPSLFDTGPEVPAPEPTVNALEQTTVETDGAPGGVVVSAEQIEKLMAERNAAARAEVEKKEPPESEQPPAPAPEEKTTGEEPPAKKEKATGEEPPAKKEKATGEEPPPKRKRPPRKKRPRRRKSPRAGVAASPGKKKRSPPRQKGRGPARAAHPRMARRPLTRPRPHLETKCPKARAEREPRPPR